VDAVANYNVGRFSEAERSAREALKFDTQHRDPEQEHLLGIILAGRQPQVKNQTVVAASAQKE